MNCLDNIKNYIKNFIGKYIGIYFKKYYISDIDFDITQCVSSTKIYITINCKYNHKYIMEIHSEKFGLRTVANLSLYTENLKKLIDNEIDEMIINTNDNKHFTKIFHKNNKYIITEGDGITNYESNIKNYTHKFDEKFGHELLDTFNEILAEFKNSNRKSGANISNIFFKI